MQCARFPRLGQRLLAVLGWLSLTVPVGASAQRTTRCARAEQIRGVAFRGSPHLDALALATNIVTHEPGVMTRVFRVGNAPCLDTLEMRRDALRLAVLHRQAGWFQAGVVSRIDRRPNGVRVLFEITAGPELRLERIAVTGLPDSAQTERRFAAPLAALTGKRLDRTRLDTTIADVLMQLKDAGFARARVAESRITIDSVRAAASVMLRFDAGVAITIGHVQIRVQSLHPNRPRIDSAMVAEMVRLAPGTRLRASAMLEAQRALYRSEAFRLVLLDTATSSTTAADSVLDLRITVAEARTRNARLGVGWATQDCGRAQGRLVDRSFLGLGRRLELSVRASKLGVGAPLDVAPALCSGALRQDPFSARVNYFVGTTVSATRLFGASLSPTLSLYSERRGEPFAYLRETSIGALAEVSRTLSTRTSATAGFQYENGKTTTDPVVSCTRFGQCRPEDYVLSLFGRGVGLVSTTATHDRTNNAVDPSAGWRTRGELRAGATFSELVSSLRFYRATGELAGYRRVRQGVVGARVQVARAFAPGAELVDGAPLLPQQERLFAGGQNSVRGFQQNLLGPLVYVVSQVQSRRTAAGDLAVEVTPGAGYTRAVPRGGTALMVANLEWRRGFRFIAEQLQFAAFVDAGTVWETQSDQFRWADVRATPGLGIRVATPLGPFRLDIGYQPYGPRSGRALYFAPATGETSAQILCASPRTDGTTGDFEDIFTCPATYRPPRGTGVLSRLVFHFGLGQAF